MKERERGGDHKFPLRKVTRSRSGAEIQAAALRELVQSRPLSLLVHSTGHDVSVTANSGMCPGLQAL